MSSYKVEICGVNTAKLPILKEEEKEALFERIHAGDKKARETYIEGNLRLVLSVIRRFNNHNENVEDLFQIGCIGLIKAIDRFDPDTGNAFSTYAVPMILGEIRRFMRDDRQVHVSRKIMEDVAKITAVTRNMDEPDHITVERLCELTGLKREDVIVAMDANLPVNYLSQPIGDDGVLGDVIEDANSGEVDVNRIENNILLSSLLEKLEGDERKLIYLRYVKNLTQGQIAEHMNMNQVAVSRMEKKILETLRRRVT